MLFLQIGIAAIGVCLLIVAVFTAKTLILLDRRIDALEAADLRRQLADDVRRSRWRR